jgi:hypothetical protein
MVWEYQQRTANGTITGRKNYGVVNNDVDGQCSHAPITSRPFHRKRIDFLCADISGEKCRTIRSYADIDTLILITCVAEVFEADNLKRLSRSVQLPLVGGPSRQLPCGGKVVPRLES